MFISHVLTDTTRCKNAQASIIVSTKISRRIKLVVWLKDFIDYLIILYEIL